LDFDEFRQKWQAATQPLLIVVKEKNLPRLREQVGGTPKKIGVVDEYLLVLKP
jgi:hypothetical protein